MKKITKNTKNTKNSYFGGSGRSRSSLRSG